MRERESRIESNNNVVVDGLDKFDCVNALRNYTKSYITKMSNESDIEAEIEKIKKTQLFNQLCHISNVMLDCKKNLERSLSIKKRLEDNDIKFLQQITNQNQEQKKVIENLETNFSKYFEDEDFLKLNNLKRQFQIVVFELVRQLRTYSNKAQYFISPEDRKKYQLYSDFIANNPGKPDQRYKLFSDLDKVNFAIKNDLRNNTSDKNIRKAIDGHFETLRKRLQEIDTLKQKTLLDKTEQECYDRLYGECYNKLNPFSKTVSVSLNNDKSKHK